MTDPKADPAALLERWIDTIGADDLLVVDPPDLESAVREGATVVRIGTAIFGERARKAAA